VEELYRFFWLVARKPGVIPLQRVWVEIPTAWRFGCLLFFQVTTDFHGEGDGYLEVSKASPAVQASKIESEIHIEKWKFFQGYSANPFAWLLTYMVSAQVSLSELQSKIHPGNTSYCIIAIF